ncbi:hypothetical protein C8J57DRAFT_1475089 [Mycena rebaudengoi]|nr:hypothetical protein C8J57DRAFT_1475089 [Mycena rebaudengoi]
MPVAMSRTTVTTESVKLKAAHIVTALASNSRVSAHIIYVHPIPVSPVPTAKLAPTFIKKEVVLTEEQEKNPPALPPITLRETCGTHMHKLRVKRRRSPKPTPVDPKSLAPADVEVTVYTSPIALPLPKGPAPCVAPERRRWSLSNRSQYERDPALCPGW